MPVGTSAFIVDAKANVGTVAPAGNVFVNETFNVILASYHMSITAASGGTNLPSVSCGKIEIQNLSGNHVMWWGGVDLHAPFSGRGNELLPMSAGAGFGDKIIYISNPNQVSVCASVSGELISFVAYGNGANTTIDPSTQGTAPGPQTSPVLSGTTPLSGTVNIFNQSAVWTFSKNMSLATMNTSGLYVVTSGSLTHIGGTITFLSGTNTATFSPNSGQYTLSGWFIPMVDPSVQDINGNALSGGAAVSGNPFQIQGPPIVSGWSPLSGTTGTSGGQIINVTFSQLMAASTVNTSGLFVVVSGQASFQTTGHLSGVVVINNNDNTQASLTINSGQFQVSTWYIPFATTRLTDQFGNALNVLTSGAPFQTAASFGGDTTPPVVSGTVPASGAYVSGFGTVDIGTNVTITMSKPVLSGTVTTVTNILYDITAAANVASTVSLQSNLTTIVLTPNSVLGLNHQHRIEVSGVTDLAGNFNTPFSGATFTTQPAVFVSTENPANGATNVAVGVVTLDTMSRAVASSTVNTATVVITDSLRNRIAGSVSLNNDNVTIAFTPSTNLGFNSKYYYNISGIQDLALESFMVPHSGNFFTTQNPALTQFYNVGSNTSFRLLSAGNYIRAGEGSNDTSSKLNGNNCRQAQFTLLRVGSPTGTVFARVRDTNDNIKTTLGSINVTSISTSYATFIFTNLSGNFSIAKGTKILAEFSGGDTSNYLQIMKNGAQPFSDDGHTFFFYYDNTWHSDGSTDGTGIMWK